MTDTTTMERGRLAHERFRAALAKRTDNRLHEATGKDIADALDDAGLADAPPHLLETVIDFALRSWRADCEREMLAALAAWEPSAAERARPH